MHKIGIECESIEDAGWGIGRIIKKLLEEIANKPELQKEFRFFLYFKSKIPDLPYLNNPIFVKKVVRTPFLPASFSVYYYLLLPVKLLFEGLDLMYFPNYMLPCFVRSKTVVDLTEDIYYEFKEGSLPFRYKLAYRIFSTLAARRATAIETMSETSKARVAELFGIPESRIFANPLGVDAPKKAEKLLNDEYILYVGQAFPRRHLRETMLAFRKIASRFPELNLIAIGKDKYNPPIISDLAGRINNELGSERISLKDYVPEDELISLYASAKLVIYVSSKEAFGLPPLEALAYGSVPVVALDDITHEIFGINAFFVEKPDEPSSIAGAIERGLIDVEKRAAIINAAPKILSRFTWHGHAERFFKMLRNILN